MAREIARDEAREMMGRGITLAEVMARSDYEREHIRGAISLPLRTLDDEAPGRLRPDAPVIVYCYDYQ
jgi:rhodanese-related sulfurtransferase